MKKKIVILIVILGSIFLGIGAFIFNDGKTKEKKDEIKNYYHCKRQETSEGITLDTTIELYSKNGIVNKEIITMSINDDKILEEYYEALKEENPEYSIEKKDGTILLRAEYDNDKIIMKNEYERLLNQNYTCK